MKNFLKIFIAPLIITALLVAIIGAGFWSMLVLTVVWSSLYIWLGPSWFAKKVGWVCFALLTVIICWSAFGNVAKSWFGHSYPMAASYIGRFQKGNDLLGARALNRQSVEARIVLQEKLRALEEGLAKKLGTATSSGQYEQSVKEFETDHAKIKELIDRLENPGKMTSTQLPPNLPTTSPSTQVMTPNMSPYEYRGNVTYVMDTKSMENSGWIAFPVGKSGLTVKPDDRNYVIEFNDNTSYPGDVVPPAKDKSGIMFKIRSLKNAPEKIYITISV